MTKRKTATRKDTKHLQRDGNFKAQLPRPQGMERAHASNYYSNHPFSGAKMLVSGQVYIYIYMYVYILITCGGKNFSILEP